jgi:hypothetical protein
MNNVYCDGIMIVLANTDASVPLNGTAHKSFDSYGSI